MPGLIILLPAVCQVTYIALSYGGVGLFLTMLIQKFAVPENSIQNTQNYNSAAMPMYMLGVALMDYYSSTVSLNSQECYSFWVPSILVRQPK